MNRTTHPAIRRKRPIRRLVLPCSRSMQARIVHRSAELAGALNRLFNQLADTRTMPLRKQLATASILRHTYLEQILRENNIAHSIEYACERRFLKSLPRVIDAIYKAVKKS